MSLVIFCARADAELVIPGSDLTHVCYKCRRKVMLSPSGQAYLRSHPGAKLACYCALPERLQSGSRQIFGAPAETMLRELRSAQPNPYRRRN